MEVPRVPDAEESSELRTAIERKGNVNAKISPGITDPRFCFYASVSSSVIP